MAEDRVYEADTDATEVVLAGAVGVVTVDAAAGRVGGFGLAHQCSPRDIAGDGVVAVATDETVLHRRGETFENAGFGPAVAVGVTDGTVVVAGPDGHIATFREGEWYELGRLEASVRAIDGDLVATDAGVYRVEEEAGIEHVGLEDVHDVAAVASGEPLAATQDGLFELTDRWERVQPGAFEVVASSPPTEAHAATAERVLERRESTWAEADLPVAEAVIDIDYGEIPYAVTKDGTLLTSRDEWRAHPLGVRGVVGMAVP